MTNLALPMLSVHGYCKKVRIDENRSTERFLVSNYMPPAGIEPATTP